jgi:predicted RND superfamily exporter protein
VQHHITIPRYLANFILKQSRLLVTIVAAITLLASWQIYRTPVSISALESFTSDIQTFREYQQRAELFGGDSDMLVFAATHEGEQLFTAKTLNAIRAAAHELKQFPEIEQVTALTEIPLTTDQPPSAVEMALRDMVRKQVLEGKLPAVSNAFPIPAWWPQSATEQAKVNLPAMKKLMQQNQLLARRLISEDGNSHCMLIRLNADSMGLGAKWKLRSQLENTLKKHELGREQLHLSGLPISEGWILVELVSCLKYQLPLGVLIIGTIVFVTYRSLSIAGLTIAVGAVASIWAVATTSLIFGKITILVAAVPLLIMVISTSDTIHIVSAYCKEYSQGLSIDDALMRVIQDVGGACVLTSLTTLVGFLSLLLIPVTAIRHLAVTAGVGVAIALILAISLVPIGISRLKIIAPANISRTTGGSFSIVELLIASCRWVSTKYPGWVVTVHILLLALAGYYAMGLQFDPNLAERFRADHPMPTSVDYFNKNFCGTNFVEVFIQGDSDELLSPGNLERMREVQQNLLKIPEIRSVSSPINLFASVDQIIGFQTSSGLPPSPAAALASLNLIASIQPDLVRTMVTPEANQIRMTATTSLSGFFEVLQMSDRVQSIVAHDLPNNLKVEVSGFMPVIARSVETIVDSQFSGLLFCFTVVLGIVMLALRSFRLGLISLFPNLFPLLVLAGLLAFSFPAIDSDFIIIFTIAFGIAVDDTIHFLHRYDVEFTNCRSRRQAVVSAFSYSGHAIVQTTVVLGLGLLPLAMSNYLTIQMLGTYLVLTLVLALLADLLLLPALVLLLGGASEYEKTIPEETH